MSRLVHGCLVGLVEEGRSISGDEVGVVYGW